MDMSTQPPYQIPPLEDARRQYVELFGSALVMNTYLKIALLCVSLVAVGLLLLNFRTQSKYANVKPLVIRIDGFLTGTADEAEIQVRNVTLDDLKAAPYKAVVEFDKVYTGYGNRQERSRETYVAQITFVLRSQ